MADIDLSIYESTSVTESKTVCTTREISKYESVTVSEDLNLPIVGRTDPRESYWPKMPVRTLEASGAIVGTLDSKFPDRSVTGYGASSLNKIISTRSLEASGSFVESGTLNSVRGTYSGIGYSGGSLDKRLSTRELYGTGYCEDLYTGNLDVTLTQRTLEATGTYEIFGSLNVTIPQRTLEATGFNRSGSLDKRIPVRYVSESWGEEEIHGVSVELVMPVRSLESSGDCLSGSLDCEISPRVMTFSVIGKESGEGVESGRFSNYTLGYSR